MMQANYAHGLRLLAASLLMTGAPASSLEVTPSESLEEPPVISPEVRRDHHVTFRLADHEAKTVTVVGVAREAVTLRKDRSGVWTADVGPLKPGLYEYSFMVDGEERLDPSNPRVKPDRDLNSSLLEISYDQPLFYQWRDIPHGTVHLHDYFSKPLQRLRGLRVYTPPNYNKHPDVRYPVLYLLHGTGDTEATWSDFGRAHVIIDNLLADKKALPMLIVMPDGHADLHEEEGIHQANFIKFEKDLVESIMPFVEDEYRTVRGPEGRAICGLSMGGMQSLYLGLNHPDLFAWVGGMSGYVPDAEKMCPKAFVGDSINSKLKLLWHSIGKEDSLFSEYARFDGILEAHHIKRQFRVTEGAHEWRVWRQYLADFAPLLFR
jgi:enterochelin esterase-like enzyme